MPRKAASQSLFFSCLSSTTMNLQGCELHAEGAHLAASKHVSILSRSTGLSRNALVLLLRLAKPKTASFPLSCFASGSHSPGMQVTSHHFCSSARPAFAALCPWSAHEEHQSQPVLSPIFVPLSMLQTSAKRRARCMYPTSLDGDGQTRCTGCHMYPSLHIPRESRPVPEVRIRCVTRPFDRMTGHPAFTLESAHPTGVGSDTPFDPGSV